MDIGNWWTIFGGGLIIGAGITFGVGMLWINQWLKKYDLVPTKEELQRREKKLDKELKI